MKGREKQPITEMATSRTFLRYQVVKNARNSVSKKVSWNHTNNIHGTTTMKTVRKQKEASTLLSLKQQKRVTAPALT